MELVEIPSRQLVYLKIAIDPPLPATLALTRLAVRTNWTHSFSTSW